MAALGREQACVVLSTIAPSMPLSGRVCFLWDQLGLDIRVKLQSEWNRVR